MSGSGAPSVAVSHLDAGYAEGRAAICGLEFSVAAGSSVAVIGPNGGGKTTLFRALLGEAPYRRGEVELAGSIAYVPQSERARLDFPVSALDVALMGTYGRVPWYRRIGARERRAAREALARVGMESDASTAFGELSGGQRQRVLIARALAQGAAVLLLDEPLMGVDQPAGEQILSVLRELSADGHTVLLSTHDIEQARAFDEVLCLNGRQIAYGPPEVTLSPAVLEQTYGGELIVLPRGERAIVVQHHHH